MVPVSNLSINQRFIMKTVIIIIESEKKDTWEPKVYIAYLISLRELFIQEYKPDLFRRA